MSVGRMQGAAVLAMVAMLAACDAGTDDAADLAVNDTIGAETSAGATADAWNDAQIFGLLARMNGGRMAAAELAKERATNAEVRQLADTIDQAHVEMERRLSELAQQMNVTPVAPEDSAIIAERNEDLAELQGMPAGLEWDRQFVDDLESWAQETHDVFTRAIESTHSPELRQALTDMRTTVERHRELASQVKERLG